MEDSLNQSMDKAVQHYSSLFKLPSYKKVVCLLALVCVGIGWLSTIFFSPLDESLLKGFYFSLSLFIITLILDSLTTKVILKGDLLYDLRRTAAVSLVSLGVWLFFVVIGVALALPFGVLWYVRLCLLGFSAVMIFRLIVLDATSSVGHGRSIVAALVFPFFWSVLFFAITIEVNYAIFLFTLFSLGISFVASFSFLFILDREGKRILGASSLSFLRAFLLNWVLDLNKPLETLLETSGEERNVEVSLLKFTSSQSKAAIVVPSIHPGPFKNVGSSLLPSLLKTAMEEKLNCIVGVPHGLLGHEFDLASQTQNEKVIEYTVQAGDVDVSYGVASPFVTVSNGVATACCQIFGDCAFLSFTLAPKTTEDFPEELGLFICQEAKKRGLKHAIIVNAHNCIDGQVNIQDSFEELKKVAIESLEKALSIEKTRYYVGVASVKPEEFNVKQGMGPSGITVLVSKVGEQKTAYVIIDGNNMVSGLREEVLSALSSIGIDTGEVFTTDTHVVTAVILNKRGYHPIGEALDRKKLVEFVKKVTLDAISGMEQVKSGCCQVTIHNVKVIGKELLEKLCTLIETASEKAKKIAVPIFVGSGLLLMLFLVFI